MTEPEALSSIENPFSAYQDKIVEKKQQNDSKRIDDSVFSEPVPLKVVSQQSKPVDKTWRDKIDIGSNDFTPNMNMFGSNVFSSIRTGNTGDLVF